MASTDGLKPKVNYSDGEALTDGDLNRMSHAVDARAVEVYSRLNGGDIGNVFDMGQGASKEGNALANGHQGNLVNFDTVLIDPYPLSSPFNFGEDVNGDAFVGNGVLGMKHSGLLPGTRPSDSPDVLYALLDSEALTLATGRDANAAPGAGDPRWDCYGIRFSYTTGNPDMRDFEDAVTRALSSGNTDKDHILQVDDEYVVGSQSATYDVTAIASLSAGFVPAMIVRRPVGSGTTLTADDIHYLGFPTRLGFEDVMGYEGQWSRSVGDPYDITAAFAPTDGVGEPAAEWFGASGGSVLRYWPRTMHPGCRLVGIMIIGQGFDQDQEVSLMRSSWTSLGVHSVTKLANLDDGSSSGRLNAEAAGVYASGIGSDPDWAIVGGARFPTPGYPVWGNGRTYGPTSHDQTQGPVAVDKLFVQLENPGGDTYDAGDRIHLVRFVYLH